MLRIEENGQMRIRCRRKKIPRKLQRERGLGTKSGKQFVDWNSQERQKKKDRKILYHEMNHSTFPDSNNIQTWLWYYQYYIQKSYTYLKYKSIIQLSCVRSNKGWKRTNIYMYRLIIMRSSQTFFITAITWHDIQQFSLNLPEFTRFVQLMNWQNNSCKFV